MSPAQNNGIPGDLVRLLDGIGARVTASRPIDYGTQHTVSQGTETATINVYRTSKVAIGGKASTLKQVLEEWRLARTGGGAPARDAVGAGAGPGAAALDPAPGFGAAKAGKGASLGPWLLGGGGFWAKERAKRLSEMGFGIPRR